MKGMKHCSAISVSSLEQNLYLQNSKFTEWKNNPETKMEVKLPTS